MEGIVLSIARASLHDGPGIRTTVFLKGCSLSCIWCHNPESHKLEPQLFYKNSLCVLCGKCEAVCENRVHHVADQHIIYFDKCKMCGKCIENCPTKALTVVGQNMSVEEIMKAVVKDRAFYENSGGGLTISGGEPMGSQIEFTCELLKTAKENGIGTAVETSGFAPEDHFKKIIPYTDYFLMDFKTAPDLYKKYTGAEFSVIEKNLQILDNKGAHVILRCPVIPTVNDNEVHLRKIAEITEKFKVIKSVELMFYHTFGISKSRSIGVEPAFIQEMMDGEKKRDLLEKLEKMLKVPVS